jgi:hypothetical protein
MTQPLPQYHNYIPLRHNKLSARVDWLLRVFDSYADDVGLSDHDIVYSKSRLYNIIEIIHKREVYFKVLYGQNMPEKYAIALYCFEIMNLSPFFDKSNPEISVNINFSIYFLLKYFQHIGMKSGKKITFPQEYLESLKDKFSFSSMVKDSTNADMQKDIARAKEVSGVVTIDDNIPLENIVKSTIDTSMSWLLPSEAYQLGVIDGRKQAINGTETREMRGMIPFAEMFYNQLKKIVPEDSIRQHRIGIDNNTGVPTSLTVIAAAHEKDLMNIMDMARDLELWLVQRYDLNYHFWVITDSTLDQVLIDIDFPYYKSNV